MHPFRAQFLFFLQQDSMSCLDSFSLNLLPFSFESNKVRSSPSQFHRNGSMKATSGFFLPTLRSVIYWFSASSSQVNVSFFFETFSFLCFYDKKPLVCFLPHQEFLLCNLRNLYHLWIPHHLPKRLDLECLCSVLGLFFFLYTYFLVEFF